MITPTLYQQEITAGEFGEYQETGYSECTFTGDFVRANFCSSEFEDCNFDNATFERCNFSNAVGIPPAEKLDTCNTGGAT